MESDTKKRIPSLRFKDDRGDQYSEWEIKSLGEVGEVIGGGTPDTTNRNLWNGSIIWYTPVEIDKKYSSHSMRNISQSGLQQSSAKLLPAGTVLLTTRATIGRVTITTNECTTNQGFQSFVVDGAKFSNEFLYYWITRNVGEFIRRANGSTYLEVSAKEIKKIDYCVPTIIEQQKIADFLSSIDIRIEQLEKKLTLLTQYKKGVMQGLFSQKIRFNDELDREYPKWREVKLDELSEVVRGVTFDKSDALDVPSTGRLPVLRAGNISEQLDLSRDLVWLPNEIISQTQRLKKRDIVMCASSGSSSIVGKCATVRQKWNGTVGAFCFIIRANSRKIDSDYLTYFLKSEKFYRWTKSAEGTNIKNIRLGDLRKYRIPFPLFAEQKKIADFLLSIDRQIELTSEQIGKAREYKMGLLQQMFV